MKLLLTAITVVAMTISVTVQWLNQSQTVAVNGPLIVDDTDL